jgi:hypothetical protein
MWKESVLALFELLQQHEGAGYINWHSHELRAGWPEFYSRQEQEIFLYSTSV